MRTMTLDQLVATRSGQLMNDLTNAVVAERNRVINLAVVHLCEQNRMGKRCKHEVCAFIRMYVKQVRG